MWDGNGNAETKVAVEPLLFRSVQEALQPEVVEPSVNAPAAEPVPDLEASLREAHEQGRREAQAALEAELQQKLADERASVSRVMEQFEQEKQRYFTEVEGEVVRLSLAIAERVLHREAEMDPTLLAGAARVALEQVADGSEAVLRVSAEEAQRWNETLGKTSANVQIEPDEHMARGEAVLKTRSGSVQLGLKAQLQEIERGFFELLGRRPAVAV